MNEELINHQLEAHERRINNHSERIDRIENRQAETNVRMDNLCKSIDGLTSTMKWFLGGTMSVMVGFFIWVIQENLF